MRFPLQTPGPRGVPRLPALLLAAILTCLPAGAPPAAPEDGRRACAGCVHFRTTYVDTPEAARLAFAHAERVWGSRLVSAVPVRVRVSFRPLQAKASTVPYPVRGFTGAPDGITWYPTALADALSGRDLDPSAHDMEIFFSDRVEWYFGTDGAVPAGKVDFVSVALHELAHGLGFASRLSFAGGGAFTGSQPPGASLPGLSFEVPDLQGLPTVFDRFIETAEGKRPMDIEERLERSTCLGRAVLKGELYFGGESAARRNGGRRPRLSATDPSHVDQRTYEWSPDGLMTPTALKGRALKAPGAIVLGVLEDLGWRVQGDPAPGAAAGGSKPAEDRLSELRVLIH